MNTNLSIFFLDRIENTPSKDNKEAFSARMVTNRRFRTTLEVLNVIGSLISGGATMSISQEIGKIREVIRSIEDPSTATALRHICKALEEMEKEVHTEGERESKEERLQ